MNLPSDCASSYSLIRELGSGGFGTVWLAMHKTLGREVALKVLNQDMMGQQDQRTRFLDEARVTATLSDPHIVKVLDHGSREVPWIAYEYLPGRNLSDILASGPVPWRTALQVVEQVAGALETAHAQGVLHRDIKADNVLESAPGHYKVADFGIASWGGSRVQTQNGFLMGTPTHLAPELWTGGEASELSDVYALGIVLFHLLIGKLPFAGDNLSDIFREHVQAPPTRCAARANKK